MLGAAVGDDIEGAAWHVPTINEGEIYSSTDGGT
jgi:hypothetical protein